MPTEGLKVTRKQIEDILVASIRFTGQVSRIPAVFDKLFALLAAAGGKMNGNPMVLFYPSYELGDDDDVEVCIPVSEKVETDEIKSRLIEGGDLIATSYHGPHDGEAAEAAWNDLFAYINENDIKVRAPSREIYLEWDKDAPENNVTELQFPLI